MNRFGHGKNRRPSGAPSIELLGRHSEVRSLFRYFPRLEPAKLERLAKAMSVVRLKRGSAVLNNLRSRKDLLLVLKGAIAVTWRHDDRPQVLVTLLAPGEMLGIASLLPEAAQGLRAYAFTNSMVATINSAKLLDMLFGVDLETFKSAMETTVGWSFETLIRYIRMFQLPPRDRLMIVLSELGAKFGVRDSRGLILNLPMTQNDLANLLGASRQKVNADLGALVRLGAVINRRRSIVLVPERLAALVGDPELRNSGYRHIDSTSARRMVSLH